MSNNAKISYEKISDVLKTTFSEFKKNPHTEPLFVFPTEIEKNSWIDWVVLNSDESKVDAVSTEQFIAWDEFKSKYIQPVDSDKNCIPPLIRKVFAQRLLQKVEFKKLISKDSSDDSTKKNNDSIFAFTDWLAGILPSLALWEKHYSKDFKDNVNAGNTKDDDENADFMELYTEYLKLLTQYNFFEPSYADIIFSNNNRRIYIFYPTIIQDFSEYIDTLTSSENVTLVVLPPPTEEEKSKIDCTKCCVNYPDARKELRRLALQIRKLMDDDVDLTRVAINVPDLENIRPYIEREFRLYEIPFVTRNGIPYTRNCGGDVFGKIKDCIDTNFSLDAMRNILMDGFLPWRDAELNLRLVQAGVKQRIVCSSTEDNDIWLTSFEGKLEYKDEKEYYEKLKNVILKFANAKSFRDLKIAWLDFSKEFIDEKQYEDNPEVYGLTDKILGRIITELSEYATIEEDFNKKYPDAKLSLNNYLDFFVNEIEQKSYTPNEKKYGVNILSYRVAACADFDYQFIINANQDDITVPLKTLSFIKNEDKRRLFGLTYDDPENKTEKTDADYMRDEIRLSDDGSAEFVRLYNAQYRGKEKEIFWSSAKQNFNGAAITHTALKEFDTEKVRENKENGEASKEEIDFLDKLDSLDDNDFVKKQSEKNFTAWQRESFDKWAERNGNSEYENEISENLKKKINEKVLDDNDNIKISASSISSFYPCPKNWLFQNVMGIDDEKYSAKLAESYEIGILYHKVLELMFNVDGGCLKNGCLPCYKEDDEAEVRSIVKKYLTKAIEEENAKKEDKKSDLFKSKLSTEVLEQQRPIIEIILARFVMQFCKEAEDEKSVNGNYGGYKVEATEKWIEALDSENKILFHGKIDLILSNGKYTVSEDDGTQKEFINAVIIDYKTGTPPTASENLINDINKIKKFQMAMYIKLLESTTNADGIPCKVQNGLFYSLKDNNGDFDFNYVIDTLPGKGNARKVDRKGFTNKGTESLFMEYAVDFASKIKSFNFSTSNKYEDKNYINPYEDCKKCRYKSSCRKTFNIGKMD